MEYINGVSTLYIKKFGRKLSQYNKHGKLPEYFREMIGEKKGVDIAELGAGPINTIGDEWPDVSVCVHPSDILCHEYNKLWEKHKAIPVVSVLYEDMEKLSYLDEVFDIVHCVNALDHTKNADKALAEMKRICRKGGWIYIRCAQNQRSKFGGQHYWDAMMGAGKMILIGEDRIVNLDEFTAHREGELIVALWQKT